ncbi:MAG: uracil-DNA glycosylase [Candidatus Riflebacteria bacterium]|nr:uracil-DNA glycosylase [Candidatus Riflebacteria bacterium]
MDCRKCVHFFVTWEKNCPYGCKAYGFKGPQMPSIVVKSSSGESCYFFKQRV